MQGAAYYEDEYVKEDGRWLILHTGYQRVFEQTWSERDLPSLVRRAPWWERSST
jgi:Lon protease-like protein